MIPENPFFQKIVEKYRTPEYIRATFVKNVAQLHYALKLKPKWLNPNFREAADKVRQPIGWRKEILKRWRKTILKGLIAEKIKGRSGYRVLGNASGLFANIEYYGEKEMSDDESQELLNAVFAPFFENLREEEFEKIGNEIEKLVTIMERIEKEALQLSPSKQQEFSAGYTESVNALFNDQRKFIYQNTTTEIYQFFLAFGDLLGELRSVKEVYAFAQYVLGKELFHTEEDFRQICHRIGFRGTSYLASTRRRKSIDRAKRRVY